MHFRMKGRMNPRIKTLDEAMRLDAQDMRNFEATFDTEFRDQMKSAFSTEGKTGAFGWPPLSPDYAAYKAKKRPGRKMLVFDGNLRRSLTTRNAEHIAEGQMPVGKRPAVVSLGTRNPLAAYHGISPYRNKNLPVRDALETATTQASLAKYTKLARLVLGEKLKRINAFLNAAGRVL